MTKTDVFDIAGKQVGAGAPAYLIAEVAQSHDGSLGLAHAFIDAAADAGADAIKFQTHIAAAESTSDEPFRVRFSVQDETRYDYWKRMEFSVAGWQSLFDHAKYRQLAFLSSAFSLAAVDLLDSIGVPAWKVGSGEYKSIPMIEKMAQTGRPILFSTGMSSWDEIRSTVDIIRPNGCPFAVLQCTSKYPTPIDEVGLNVLQEFGDEFSAPVGLSDHSGSIWPSVLAIARGASMIEAHLTLDRRMFGPDVPASLTVDEFRQVSTARDTFARLDDHPVDKDKLASDLKDMRAIFTRSLSPVRALEKGEVVIAESLIAKKPGTGIPEARISEVIGRKLIRDVPEDRLLSWDDLED